MNNHLSSFDSKKIMRYGVGNPSPGLEQAQNCSCVKLVHGISPPLIVGSSMTNTYINKCTYAYTMSARIFHLYKLLLQKAR